ncbi:MAG: sigma-54-dependent Fis family transcriptional regulator [Bacteroidetes bacterium]|nr:sigma-54-dependent Fis family transcriptional regulator [Bacteroidota bacterium]
MKKLWNIMVVDDEEVMRESLAAWLREDGYTVDTAESGLEAIDKTNRKDYAIYFIDLKMPGGRDGIETMMEIRKVRPEASIIIVTAYATVDTAITAMKEGAQEYIVKPCNPEEISLLVSRIIKIKNLQRENSILRKKLTKQYSFCDIISKNPKMVEIFGLIKEVASLRSTVMIQGESGTGKELIARAIHFSGDRAAKPFVGVSCAALTESLLESELFGHEKGSFTGATGQKKGKFEIAEGGTIFLDEIGDISPKLQMSLLRILQERNFYRVGGTDQIDVDVRVIAATNRDLEQAVKEGRFRDDLFYRLNVINIHLPALRDRKEDIPLLVHNFIEHLGPELGKDVQDITEGGMKVLLNHQWPGNVRELENAVERAIVTCRSKVLTEEDFTFLIAHQEEKKQWEVPANLTLDEIENQAITVTLRRTHGNIKEASSILGVDRSTLYDRIKRYNLPRN